MTSSAQFETESERTRAHLSDTLAELRSRMTVGQVADQIWELAKDGVGGDFARNLVRQAANNPLPIALMGTGLAWLMFARSDSDRTASYSHVEQENGVGNEGGEERPASTRPGVTRSFRRARRAVRRTVHDVKDAAAAASASVAEGVASAANEAAAAAVSASSAYEEIKRRAGATGDTAAAAYENVKETVKESAMQTKDMVIENAKAAKEYAGDTAQRVADFCVDNPLVLIGAGMALGAIAGALLPATEMENELMGETSNQVKQQAEHLAAAQLEKVERVGEEIIDHATDSATREFSSPDRTAQTESPSM